jgi:hypothetical protein
MFETTSRKAVLVVAQSTSRRRATPAAWGQAPMALAALRSSST